jgi:hypothetical protein
MKNVIGSGAATPFPDIEDDVLERLYAEADVRSRKFRIPVGIKLQERWRWLRLAAAIPMIFTQEICNEAYDISTWWLFNRIVGMHRNRHPLF